MYHLKAYFMIFHHFKTSNSSLKWKRQRMITFTSKLCILQQFPGVHSKMFSSSPCYIKVYLLQFPNCNLFLLLFHSSTASSQNLLTLLAFFHLFSLPRFSLHSPRNFHSLLPAVSFFIFC